MATPAEEEELRETYYIRCRNEGYTIEEACERSLAYIKRILNADKSLATTRYLEQLYQDSKSRPEHSSTHSSYDDDLLRRSGSLGNPKDGDIYHIFGDFSDMRDSIFSIFAVVQRQHEKDSSVPGRRAPEYIPSPYDYRNNPPELRGGYYEHAHGQDRSALPRQSAYVPRTSSCNDSYYTTEDRHPPSAYECYASDSTYSFYSPLPTDFKPYASPDSYTAGSFRSSRSGPPPSYSHTRSSSSHRHVPPRPEGVEPATDLYTVLGVTRNATAAEIRKAHRALSLRWHPDRYIEQDKKEATGKMAEINQANDVLCDEVKRAFYDQWGVLSSGC
ncbi:uncharacterized protein ALTATR162_LOCUS4258 [Alternaria atra]|uniref:J domain-containing protein n=1 Tax=Alternaria atra TaxID=119953 RepID=A0A8J2N4V6_9PLEO|nr:uncharacterized protein ALTATR162_LOCUS4258 [Alternaria atra]CAG5156460.1 unnamed protein product [Alternaria atra]